ncbi:hypothetical protein HMPREF9622_01417 [Cutibacterium modestum HL037PA3]|uniref:Uncharacterized protein n=1 Tax=Cutibacterium modestum HL044PA1 TaxID=765109 RepID=A0ABN0C7B8_9ACTN|nr:hypothetical protein HMPREF9621_01031 [Cutibacterium modestum HL037PA2]EFS93204.1 hypothetical protein HMPREF9607_00416 [Cutibacterium modestum HL044PA1]EFT15642.1 hypothetical protein HMPREF9622_01417 [Cutibacterium modestum HL037PA3]
MRPSRFYSCTFSCYVVIVMEFNESRQRSIPARLNGWSMIRASRFRM